MEHKNIPEIRFSGFTNEWEQRKLGDLSKVIDPHPSHRAPAATEVGIPFIGIGDVDEVGNINYKTARIVDEKIFEEHHNRYNLAITSIGIGRVASLGKVIRLRDDIGKYAVSPTMSVIQFTNNNDLDFLYSNMNTPIFQKQFKSFSNGSTRQSVGIQDLRTLMVSLPIDIEEQKKIGLLFKQLDDTIALHQRKLDLLKEQKKGFLQKMFPKAGEKIPELRFKGFTDDWEQRKLGELSNIVGGGTPSTSNPEYWDGDIDWYAPAEIGEQSYVSKSKKTITELGLKKSSARILPVGTVLFTSRAGIGNTAILAKEATTNQGFQSIVPDQNKLDSYFIFSRTNELKRYGEVTGAGSTFVEVSGKQMSKMSIMVPELSEQQKIGSFFKQLDDTIVLHQRKLELLKEQKKGFLQKMFPKNS
ncbi:restriction endonuclease subunit S [Brochothrix thermosphacta]|uniref:restriction endonuclease subunit S n=1 Tax=Brochothrix thermosphacta TaxID=2756 RepID=UPI0009BEBA1F|nr:restriction endonuclease subunit S [Brochothrix thermosphacta]